MQALEALNQEAKVPYAPMMNSAKYPRKVSERFAHFPEDALEVRRRCPPSLSLPPPARRSHADARRVVAAAAAAGDHQVAVHRAQCTRHGA